jgi:dihydroneopterin aldolase
VTTSRLFLSGIRASGRHGARTGEKDEPQPLVVDLDLTVEVAEDAIGATADYRVVIDVVRSIVEGESFDLIEMLADRIANEIFGLDRVVSVTAVVHKPNAATRLEIDGVAAAVTVGGRA